MIFYYNTIKQYRLNFNKIYNHFFLKKKILSITKITFYNIYKCYDFVFHIFYCMCMYTCHYYKLMFKLFSIPQLIVFIAFLKRLSIQKRLLYIILKTFQFNFLFFLFIIAYGSSRGSMSHFI